MISQAILESKPQNYFVTKIDNDLENDFRNVYKSNEELQEISRQIQINNLDVKLLFKEMSGLGEQLGAVNFQGTRCVLVSDEKQLEEVIDALMNEFVIAWDVHNHSFRSFQGFICFLEISCPKIDYIFDGIRLRESLHKLSRVFESQKVLKLTLSSQKKVLWLQRDYGIVCNNQLDLQFVTNSPPQKF